MRRSMLNDDSGTNILIEYTLALVVFAALFVVLLLMLNQTIRNSNTIVLNEQLGIIANQISTRITSFADEVNISSYMNSNYSTSVTGYTESLELPPIAQGDQYTVDIKYNEDTKIGYVNVSYASNYHINRSATFRSSIDVDDIRFYSSNDKGTIKYDGTTMTIYVSG